MTKILTTTFFLLFVTITPALAQQGPVHFVGFNTLKAGDEAKATFKDYVEKLTPIMAKHNMSVDVLEVLDDHESELKTSFITFGSGPGMADMQAFFRDPEFHAIFPILLGIIEDHNVVFVDKNLARNIKQGDEYLLAAGWSENQKLNTLHAKGLMGNNGVGGDITPFEPPLWMSIAK